jgi:hypothetical protein
MKTNISFLFLLSFFLILPSWSEVDKTQYQRKAKLIINNPKPKTAYKAEVPLDLLEGSINGELRIVDKNNKELPFIFEFANEDLVSEAKALKIYNQSSVPSKEQFLELDLQSVSAINELELEIQDLNFDRSVSVYGRDNKNDNWKLIKDKLKIIASHLPDQKIDFKHTILKFPETRYKFLKLKIDLKPSAKPLDVLSVKSQFRKKLTNNVNNIFNSVNLPLRKLSVKGQNKKSSLWIMDTEAKEYNFEKINFEFLQDSFSREALLYCSNKSNPQFLDDSEISLMNSAILYKFNGAQSLSIDGLSGSCKYYIVEIFQGDNLPVDISRAEGQSRKKFVKFIFEPPFELPLTIYAKSVFKEVYPSYDLNVRITKEQIKDFEMAQISDVSRNLTFKGKITSTKNKLEALIPYTGAVLLIMLIGVYIFSLAKKNNLNS